jgi:hypothetical protein
MKEAQRNKKEAQIARIKRGRPTVGLRVPLSLRVTPEFKERLDAAAEQSGRSQSQEAELRLERSFDRQDLLLDVLVMTFGSKQTAGLVILLGMVMEAAAQQAYQAMVREASRPQHLGARSLVVNSCRLRCCD